jgi:glycosyl transferase, family 25
MIKLYLVVIIILIILNLYICFSKIDGFQNQEKIKIYVINLAKSIDRWNYINNQSRGELKLIKFKAVNGKNLTQNIIKDEVDNNSYLYKNLDKNRGEIGCALSHLHLWKQFKTNTDPYMIVVEDDVIFETKFYQKLDKYLINAPKDWDIIYLGGSHIRGYKINNYFIKPEMNGRGNLGTYAMLINKKGVNNLLKYCNPITKSIDHQIKQSFNNINVYYTYPSLIHHNNDMDSDRRILNNQESKASVFWRKHRQGRIEILN